MKQTRPQDAAGKLMSPYQGILRNAIINGNGQVDQRGNATTLINEYSVDMWKYLRNGGVAVGYMVQDSDVPTGVPFNTSIKTTVATADASMTATDYSMLQHVIEGYNIAPFILGGLTATLSFRFKLSPHASSSITFPATMCVTLMNADNDRSYTKEITISAADTWEVHSFQIDFSGESAADWELGNGIGAKIFFVYDAGATYANATADSWNTGGFVDLCTSNQSALWDYAGNEFYLTGVQLHPGSEALPFDPRPYAEELRLCKRYYQYEDQPQILWMHSGANGSYADNNIILPVEMRTTPTPAYVQGSMVNIYTNSRNEINAISPKLITHRIRSSSTIGGAYGTINSYTLSAEL